MHPPCEVMMKKFLPTLRGLVAHELSARRLSQGRIARMLGMTQAAVSQYLTKRRGFYLHEIQRMGIEGSEAEGYVDVLCEDLLADRMQGVHTLHSIWRNLLVRGTICPIHQEIAPVPRGCDVCMKLLGPSRPDAPRDMVTNEMKRAVRQLELSPYFPIIMPEVSVNLVMSLEDAEGEEDVAAFPGRIVKVHGRARAMMPPEFGASHHMARMLLAAKKCDPAIRATINVKYDTRVRAILDAEGLQVMETVGKEGLSTAERDIVVASFAAALERDRKIAPVVVDHGGPGLEPITYLFGKSATEVVETAQSIAAAYHHGVSS